MKKIFLFVLIFSIIGYLYSPFRTTDAYAAALRARDFDTVNRLTDHSAYCQSIKDRMRGFCREHIRQQMSAQITVRARNEQLQHGVARWEAGLDSVLTSENTEANLVTLGQGSVDSFRFTNRGWRSALEFVAVDSNDERTVWTFKLGGWKLSANESQTGILKTRFDHLYPKAQAALRYGN